MLSMTSNVLKGCETHNNNNNNNIFIVNSNCIVILRFLYFQTPENFVVINRKFKQQGQTLRVFCQKDANSEDPDQTAPPDLGLHCLPRSTCPKKLGSLRYM